MEQAIENSKYFQHKVKIFFIFTFLPRCHLNSLLCPPGLYCCGWSYCICFWFAFLLILMFAFQKFETFSFILCILDIFIVAASCCWSCWRGAIIPEIRKFEWKRKIGWYDECNDTLVKELGEIRLDGNEVQEIFSIFASYPVVNINRWKVRLTSSVLSSPQCNLGYGSTTLVRHRGFWK